MVFICIFLIIKEICVSFHVLCTYWPLVYLFLFFIFLEISIWILSPFFKNLAVCLFIWEIGILFISWIQIPCLICKCLLPFCGVLFLKFFCLSFSWWCPLQHRSFNCDEVQFTHFFLLLLVSLMSYLRNHCLVQGHKDFLLWLLRVL